MILLLLTLSATIGLFPRQALRSIEDKTGTDPLNLQPTLELLNDFWSLPDELFFNLTAYRYARPFRARTMTVGLELPLAASDVSGRVQAGFGDLAVGWRGIAWAGGRSGILLGVDASFDTATRDALGSGKQVLAPALVWVFYPVERLIVAPSYRHRISLGGDDDRLDVQTGTLDLTLVYRFGRNEWAMLKPELDLDYENESDVSGGLTFEYGRVLFGGVSGFFGPGLAWGDRRPFDWSVHFGLRAVFE